MKEDEMRAIAKWIAEALNNRTNESALEKIRKQVLELAEAFPLYTDRRRKAASQQPAVVS
jgi:glycine hydroxymethyltransferase